MTDRPTLDQMTSDDLDQLYAERDAARATNRRLNLRAQKLESELATYRRAVDQWEVSGRGTYVPLRTIAVIARAAGRDIENPRWLMHYQRIEQAEAAIKRVVDWAATLDAIAVEVHGPGTRHPVADHIRELLDTTGDGEAPAAVSAGGQPEDTDRVVAYRSDAGRQLNCLRHVPPPAARHADYHPVTSEDLPDGGVCTYPDCGADVLIPQEVDRG